ncbi:SMP-30/gluconolactonase/LRE family protein [Neorhizobium sp. DT-125]|uniref:SMP-30/gluconolactonase/LRE family protein n=1 Tax=Neorhizobium sp. DT-125 TaxID=3396163 RepID=UPI003F1E1BF9
MTEDEFPTLPGLSAPATIAPGNHGAIVARGGEIRRVYSGGFWLEGPAAAPDGRIFFSDITQSWRTGMQGGHLMAFDPRDGSTVVFQSPSGMSNGLAFDRHGRLVACHGADFGGRCLTRTDMVTRKSTIIAGLFRGRPFNAPNDVAIAPDDRIYFTDPRYFGHEPVEQPVMGVYRIDPDGSVSLIAADTSRPNGIAVSADGRTLYVTENDFLLADRRLGADLVLRHGDANLLSYDLSAQGAASRRRMVANFSDRGPGGPDGITLDAEGNIYVTLQNGTPGILVLAQDGTTICEIPTPEPPANVELAIGPDGRPRLYICATTGLYELETRIPPCRAGKGRDDCSNIRRE